MNFVDRKGPAHRGKCCYLDVFYGSERYARARGGIYCDIGVPMAGAKWLELRGGQKWMFVGNGKKAVFSKPAEAVLPTGSPSWFWMSIDQGLLYIQLTEVEENPGQTVGVGSIGNNTLAM